MLRRIDPLQIYADVGGKQLVDAIKFCERVTNQYDRRYLNRRRASTTWHEPGRVRWVFREERGVRLDCENAWVELYWAAPDCLRVRLRTLDAVFSPPVSAVVKRSDLAPVLLDVIDGEEVVEIRSPSLVCRVTKRPFRLRVEMLSDRRVVCTDAAGVQWGELGDVRLSLTLAEDEVCYGLGMRASRLNLRGKRLRLWNTDPGSYKQNTDPLYFSVPFYLGLKEGLTYSIFWDNPNRGQVELGMSPAVNDLVFESESGELCYYLIAASDTAAVMTRYSELTGRIDIPPRWALGYGYGQFQYASAQELPRLAAEFRSRGVPCEALYLDLQQVGWERAHLKQVIAELHALDFKVIAPILPGIEVSAAESIDSQLLLRYPDGEPVVGVTWLGASFFPDFSHPVMRERWVERLTPLVDCGVDGFTLELPEPTVFAGSGKLETLPDYSEQYEGLHEARHNLYAEQMAEATEAALIKLRPEQRPVIVSRSGYAGSRGLIWTGANSASWEHLRLSIPMLLNMSLSGLPLSGVNVGGYHGDVDDELLTRWLQAACLIPVLRADSFVGTQTRLPWSFGQPYELINRLTLQLRARLMPYLYSQIASSQEYGLPIVRPLFMAEPNNIALREIDDCFLLGDLLVAPVLEKGASGRVVHLPLGLWYDYWTNETVVGGKAIEITASLERLPLFVRAGVVLPENAPDSLVLRVYPGDAESVFYEDNGEGRDLEQGNYRWVYMTCEWDEDVRFVISRRTAGRFEPVDKIVHIEVVGLSAEPSDVRLDRQGAPLWYFDNNVLEMTADDSFRRIEITRPSVPTDRTVAHRPW
jgi:alpha-glucosidase